MKENLRPYGRFLDECSKKSFACLYWLDGENLVERGCYDSASQRMFGPAPGGKWRYMYSGEPVPPEITAGLTHAEDMGLTWRHGIWRGKLPALATS